jgi:Fe-S-cluster containining protein
MDRSDGVRVLRWVNAEDRRFLGRLAADLDRGARAAGSHLACRIGCTECCIGSFPITALDARRLHSGWLALRHTEPARASAVLARAERVVVEQDTEGPCPALDPESGACDLYPARPVSCRTFGLPVRIGDDALPPCRLCFTTASTAEIEAARVTIDPDGDQQAMLAAVSQASSADESTTVAEALVRMRNHT